MKNDVLLHSSTATVAVAAGATAVLAPAVGAGIGAAAIAIIVYPTVYGGVLVWFATIALSLSIAEALLSDVVRLLLAALLAFLGLLGLSRVRGIGFGKSASVAISLSILIVLWWVLGLFNTNLPALSIGLSGVRKSVFLFLGLWIGIFLADRIGSPAVSRLVTWLLASSLVVALLLHHLAPSIESGLQRAAANSTATYEGGFRLAGLFPGPFHSALAACALLAMAWAGFMSGERGWRSTGFLAAVAGISLLEAQVRTAYVAAACVFVYLVASRGTSSRSRGTRVVAAAAIFAAAGYEAWRQSGSVASLQDAGTDSRFQSRFDSYERGLNLVKSSPFAGYGPGSAGDTLDAQAPWVHLTSHNMMLKYAVEGGVIGLVLAALLFIATWLALRSEPTVESVAARGMLIGVFVMGITGSIVESLPVTLWIFVAVGAALKFRARPAYP